MAEWIVCPTCNLRHSVRANGLCPRCQTAVGAPAAAESAPPAAAPGPPPFPGGAPAPRPPRPVPPSLGARSLPSPVATGARVVRTAACPNHPEVSEDLVRCERCSRRFCPDCVVALKSGFYCADCKEEHVRDVQSGTVTGALEWASVGRRFGALWVDGFLTTIAFYALMIPLVLVLGAMSSGEGGTAGDAPPVLFMAIIYPLAFGLPLVYEALMLQNRGQTLGKMALGLKVVTPDGGDLSTGQAWLRTAMKTILAACIGVTYIPALFTQEKTCLHDMIAKTRVVRLPH